MAVYTVRIMTARGDLGRIVASRVSIVEAWRAFRVAIERSGMRVEVVRHSGNEVVMYREMLDDEARRQKMNRAATVEARGKRVPAPVSGPRHPVSWRRWAA